MRVSFLNELSRRKVFKVAAGYAVVAWLLVEVVVTIEQPLGLPDWFDTFTIVLLAIGFPVAIILSWAFDVTPDGVKPAPPTTGTVKSGQGSVIVVSQILILLAVGFLIADQYLFDDLDKAGAGPTGVIRYKYGLDDGERLVPSSGVSVAVSPDGSKIAYVGQAETAVSQLWIRKREESAGTPIVDSADAMQPFFSPDGDWLGYLTSSRQIRIVPLTGGSALTLVDGGVYRLGADWASDGHIYFANESGIVRVNAATGGHPEVVIANNDPGEDVIAFGWPDVDTDSGLIAFVIVRNHYADDIAIARPDNSDVIRLGKGTLARFTSTGHLVYGQEDGSLLAASLDPESPRSELGGTLIGNWLPSGITPGFALSDSGRFIYATRPERTLEVVWVDRNGAWEPVDAGNRLLQMRYAMLAPDDSMLALTTWERPPSDDGQLLVKHLPDGPLSRLTFEGTVNMRPAWQPDGNSILFISDRGENRDVWEIAADGSSPARLTLDAATDIDEVLVSPGGEWLIYRQGMQHGQRDLLYLLSGGDTGSAKRLVSAEFDEMAPALSPDGRWLAFVSRRDGADDVFVRPFPAADAEVPVSINGGSEPVWSKGTNELFYRDSKGNLIATSYESQSGFKVVSRTTLFDASAYRQDLYHAAFDVTRDGQRFVMVRISDSGTLDEDLNVVENWLDEVKLAVPSE